MEVRVTLEDQLRRYVPESPYWVDRDPPFDDFNRETVQPGTNDTFPNGALGIRSDDDFWAVAALPIKYAALPLAAIVGILWPKIENPRLMPDSEDEEAWKEIFKRQWPQSFHDKDS